MTDSQRPPYSKAPIVEAVIDIRVQWKGDQPPTDFAGCLGTFGPKFPQVTKIGHDGMSLSGQRAEVSAEEVGYRLVSDSARRILQVQRSGFTYSHLPPYTEWSVFETEARPLWEQFVDCLKPERITRIGVRYLNRLQFPSGKLDLEEYLAVHPASPPSLQPVSALVLQLQVNQPTVGERCLSVLTLASEEPSNPKVQTLVLDINVFVEVDLGAGDPSLWGILSKLRTVKNQMFEAALKDKLKETFV